MARRLTFIRMPCWRAVAFSALCALAWEATPLACAAGTSAADAPSGPPVQEGWYIVRPACPFEGCSLDWMWRVVDRTPFYAADKSAKESGWFAAGQVLQPLQAYVRVRPVRGVVQKPDAQLKRGEMVWLLDPEGEGFFRLWRPGGLISWEVPDDPKHVRWDQPLDLARRLEWWVQVKPASGTPVWLRNPRGMECMDTLAGDADCKPVQGKAGQ